MAARNEWPNAPTILYAYVTSECFGINPPALDDYCILLLILIKL